MIQKMERLKKLVKQVMDLDNRTRINDKFLILSVLRKMGIKIYINYQDVMRMPSFESITRCKRKILEEERGSKYQSRTLSTPLHTNARGIEVQEVNTRPIF